MKNLRENISQDFGHVDRSSAIFWVAPLPTKTIISISNYFQYKNHIITDCKIRWRNYKGDCVKEEDINWEFSNVINLKPPLIIKEGGSCEFESISSANLKLPYAAAMAIYETGSSISMVHSYSRSFNNSEEDNMKGEYSSEGCWTLKDTNEIIYFRDSKINEYKPGENISDNLITPW